MLPNHLVPARYRVPASDSQQVIGENNETVLQSQSRAGQGLDAYESDILTSQSLAGQSGNVLLEEHDRHIRERLFSVVKIETFANVLNALVDNKAISPEEIEALINSKTTQLNESGNKIWLNLITRERASPVFYKFED